LRKTKLGRAPFHAKAPGAEIKDSWYRREPYVALSGVAHLNNEQCGAYFKLIEVTYARGAPPEDNDAQIAKWTYQSPRTWRRLKAELIDLGRIQIAGGLIIDDRSKDTLAERRRERQKAVDNSVEGALKSAQARRETGKERRKNAQTTANLSRNPDHDSRKNRGLIEPESESESESDTYLPGDRSRELKTDRPTPPGSGSRPSANVVPIDPDSSAGSSGASSAVEIHFILAKAAGSRLQLSDELFASAGFIGRAIEAGCDLRLDLLAVVIERTNGRGGPVKTWRYFYDAWIEHRDRRLSKHKGKARGA